MLNDIVAPFENPTIKSRSRFQHKAATVGISSENDSLTLISRIRLSSCVPKILTIPSAVAMMTISPMSLSRLQSTFMIGKSTKYWATSSPV